MVRQVNSYVDSDEGIDKAKIEVDVPVDPQKKGGAVQKAVTGPSQNFSPSSSPKPISLKTPDEEVLFPALKAYWLEGVGKEYRDMKLEWVFCWGWVTKQGISATTWRSMLSRHKGAATVWQMCEERCRVWLLLGSMLGWVNGKVGLRLLESLYQLPREGNYGDEHNRSVIIVKGVRGVKEVEVDNTIE